MGPKTVAFVPPRYGLEVIGGAETLVRCLAEELHRRGYPVEVLTTCAIDPYTWKTHYPPGTEYIHGVKVRRFYNQSRNIDRKVVRTQREISEGRKISRHRQEHWIRNVVTSKALRTYLRENRDRYRAFVFAPYLFGTTYEGVMEVKDKAYIIPCLHDEPFAHLSIFKKMMCSAKGIMFNSEPEMELVQRLYGKRIHGRVVGMGFEPFTSDGERFRSKYNLEGEFFLYAGRRDIAKNTFLLMRYFCNYIQNTGRGVKLVMIGEPVVNVPYSFRDHIIDIGPVDERDKRDAFSAAAFLCNPSIQESFSIVIMEAWLVGSPCLVHGDCAVTRYHMERSEGGLWFTDYPGFHEALDILFEREDLRKVMGKKGRDYVLNTFSWDHVVENFHAALENGGA